jgi:hypothetical protein
LAEFWPNVHKLENNGKLNILRPMKGMLRVELKINPSPPGFISNLKAETENGWISIESIVLQLHVNFN